MDNYNQGYVSDASTSGTLDKKSRRRSKKPVEEVLEPDTQISDEKRHKTMKKLNTHELDIDGSNAETGKARRRRRERAQQSGEECALRDPQQQEERRIRHRVDRADRYPVEEDAIQDERPKSRNSRRSRKLQQHNSDTFVETGHRDSEYMNGGSVESVERLKSRQRRSKKREDSEYAEDPGNTTVADHYAEEIKESKRSKKKKAHEPVDLGDTGYNSQITEVSPVRQRHRKKNRRRRQEEEEEAEVENEQNGNIDDVTGYPFDERLPRQPVTVHSTRVVTCRPKHSPSEQNEFEVSERGVSYNDTGAAYNDYEEEPSHTKKEKRKKKKPKESETICISEVESDFERLAPVRQNSYLDNDLSKYRNKSRSSKAAQDPSVFKDSDQSDSPQPASDRKQKQKKSTLAKMAEKKRHDLDIDPVTSRHKVSGGEEDEDVYSTRPYSSMLAGHDDSDPEKGGVSREPDRVAASHSLHSGRSGSERQRKSRKKEDQGGVAKTSVMPFRLSDDSDSELDHKPPSATTPSNVSSAGSNPGDAPRGSDESSRASEQPPSPLKPPIVVRHDSLFQDDLERDTDDDNDDDDVTDAVDNRPISDEDERAPAEPEVKGKKGKKAKMEKKAKKRSKLPTDSVQTNGEKGKAHTGSTMDLFTSSNTHSPANARKPPRPERKSMPAIALSSAAPARCDSATGSVASSQQPFTWLDKGIFSIDRHTYDVYMHHDRLSWSCITGASRVPKSRRKSFVRRSSGSMTSLDAASDVEELNSIFYCDLLGVEVSRDKKKGHQEGSGVCRGITLWTFHHKEGNRLKARQIQLEHPSESECCRWISKLRAILAEFEERPRRMKVFLQPCAGRKQSQHLYDTHVLPLLTAADVTVDLTRVNHNEHIKQEFCHLDYSLYDCLVVVGGDGSVSRVVNQVMSREQEKNGVEMTVHLQPLQSPIPIAVIPTGMTNQIVQSVQGVSDPATAAIHLLLGRKRTVDVCALFLDEKFFSWNFFCHYGYFANALSFLHSRPLSVNLPLPIPALSTKRYTLLGENKLDAAFVKALTKSKFRSYECEVQYLPVPVKDYGTPADSKPCFQGCGRCRGGAVVTPQVEHVQKLNPHSEDSDSELELDATGNSQWVTEKGDYYSVSLLSLPGRGEYCPRGMAPSAHLADGCLDLLLVTRTDKSQFTRYLRRHGNHKNQLELPFVQSRRVREVRFSLRDKTTWQHRNTQFSEIEREVARQEEKEQEIARKDSVEVVADLESEESSSEESESSSDWDSEGEGPVAMFTTSRTHSKPPSTDSPQIDSKKKQKRRSMNPSHATDSEGEVTGSGRDLDAGSHSGHADRSGSVKEKKSKKKDKAEKKANALGDYEAPPPDYVTDKDRARRNAKSATKEQKKKDKEERKRRSLWCLDNELFPDMNLHIKVYSGLLTLYGDGIKPEYEPSEVKMGCLNIV